MIFDRLRLIRRWSASSLPLTLTVWIFSCGGGGGSGKTGIQVSQFTTAASSTQEFSGRLDQLRNDLKMPGMAAVISKNQQIVWNQGFGFADVENKVAASATTSYHLASLTKTFCSTVLLQLVDQGLVRLDDPVSKYGVTLPNSSSVQVKHLLSHTSSGTPGSTYVYDGDRFALLDSVVQGASGKTFAQLVTEKISTPLSLHQTAPNVQNAGAFAASGLDSATFTANLARPYDYNSSGTAVLASYPSSFSCAAGLIASANDVAAYSMAMDRDAFLLPATKTLAWTNFTLNSGQASPYGLGWFVQNIGGTKVVWHYGFWTANSSLIIKVPDKGLTFVLLANTDRLSHDYNLAAGDIMVSPFGREFVNAFVTGNAQLP